MDPDTSLGVLLIAFAALGLITIGLFCHWDREDKAAAEDQRNQSDRARRLAARN